MENKTACQRVLGGADTVVLKIHCLYKSPEQAGESKQTLIKAKDPISPEC